MSTDLLHACIYIGRDIMYLYFKVATSRMTATNHKLLQMNSHEIYHGVTFGSILDVNQDNTLLTYHHQIISAVYITKVTSLKYFLFALRLLNSFNQSIIFCH
jgi:hypothetical protein